MPYKRTIKIPVHYITTNDKFKKIKRITAKLSYATRLFSEIIDETGLISRKELVKYEGEIREKTGLNAAYIQQCKDKAIWSWKSYNKQYKIWKNKLNKTRDNKFYNKLLKREPSKPFSNSKKKIPVRLDYRTITIKTNLKLKGMLIRPLKSDLIISEMWISLSTFEKNKRIMIPLNPSKYHINRLDEANSIIDSEIINKKGKYFLNVTCEYNEKANIIHTIKAIDLGITRSVTMVLLNPGDMSYSFQILKESEAMNKIRQYDERIAKLQELQKWKVVKRLRENRKNFVEDHQRKLARYIAVTSSNCVLAVGYPKYLKYRNYKGNEKRGLRRKIHKWSYNKTITYIEQKCQEYGIIAMKMNEYGTSSICSKCRSSKTERPYKNNYSLFKCNNCNIILNADVNASVNIAKGLLACIPCYQGAADEPALTADDSLSNEMSAETPVSNPELDVQAFRP